MKRFIRNSSIAAAFAAYPLCALAQSDSQDTTAESLIAPAAPSAPGQATIAPVLALRQPDAALRTPDQMAVTSLAPVAQAQLAPFRADDRDGGLLGRESSGGALPRDDAAGIVPTVGASYVKTFV
jgi:hypothetical protein